MEPCVDWPTPRHGPALRSVPVLVMAGKRVTLTWAEFSTEPALSGVPFGEGLLMGSAADS
ncbi:hypothetical protein [Nonomuraea endophytica]|uniref:Uncharacterized protein n=1 Tax=Nonomuraea endophytica TaxID=714136 RepID=A0A7W8A4B7_9ACTN|nr:hypothetical protein [Nonomuraea endophytica]MBB5079290.1 hypothetical protein [Nonomuraea endophytica]